MIRKPVASGQFYPNERHDLEKTIKSLTQDESSKVNAKGIILPHAGYFYSGGVAVATVGGVLPRKRIIILGPNHTACDCGFSLWAKGEWEIPFGKIGIDEDLAEKILKEGDWIKEDYLTHKLEHSLEVELPILNYFFGEFKFVPIICPVSSLNIYQEVASQLFKAVKKINEDVLLIASTDMTHYEPDQAVRKKDRQAIESIINFDEEELIAKVCEEKITMCGVAPVAILISCMKKLGAKKAQVRLYQTSADATGDCSSVVGYAGIIIK